MVAVKILKQYNEATGDTRALDCLKAYFRYQESRLASQPLDFLSSWGRWRGADNLDVVYWLYNLTGEEWLLKLGEVIHSQTADWTAMFHLGEIFTMPGDVHCVNLAQGFKAPLVWWQYSHSEADRTACTSAMATIERTIGIPNGLWAGDEHLRWGAPTRGSELCTAVEMMYSLETMLRITGDIRWADRLERVAYNALPTQAKDDFSARQYYQQTNQIACTRAWRPFSTPHDDTDLLFGTLTGYPCCLCNMHQGWPKFVQNLWYATCDGGLAALVYAPSTVTTRVAGDIDVTIRETTDYPFGETVSFAMDFPKKKVKKASFPLYIRIPAWCQGSTVLLNGEPLEVTATEGIAAIDREWKRGDVVSLTLPMEVRTEEGWDKAWSVVRGPLVYALKMEENWEWIQFEGTDRYYGAGAWQVTSPTPWNYCLMRDSFKPEACTVASTPVAGYPWNLDNAPVHITVPARELPYWKEVNGSVCEIPYWTEDGDDTGEACTIELIPYGCTTLRIAAFPTRIIPWYRAQRAKQYSPESLTL